MSQFPYQAQPSFIDGSTVEAQARERAFFASVYRWMFGGLLLTALASMWVVSSPAMQQIVLGNRVVLIGLMLAELGIVIFASAKLNTMTPAAAATCFLI